MRVLYELIRPVSRLPLRWAAVKTCEEFDFGPDHI